MKLNSISARDFMSLGDVSLDFSNYDGSPVVFTGGNGHGKSSIFEAILYCLTGKTNRGLRGSSVVKRGKSKRMFVDCKFSTKDGELNVIRYRNDKQYKNSLRVLLEGAELTKGTSELTQQFLYNLIGFTESSLTASILFGQNSAGVSSFSDTNLKTLVEAILGVMDYQRAQVEAKTESNLLKGQLQGLEGQKIFLENEIKATQDLLLEQEKKKEASDKENEEKIETLTSDVWVFGVLRSVTSLCHFHLTSKINNLNEETKKIRSESHLLLNKITQLKTESHGYDKEIKKAERLLAMGTCPTCHQKVEGATSLTETITVARSNKEELQDKILEIEETKKSIRDKERDLDEDLSELRFTQTQIAEHKFSFTTNIDELKWKIRSLKEETASEGLDLSLLSDRLKEHRLKVFQTTSQIKKLNRAREEALFWVEGFGPAGLRNHLVHTILPALNAKVGDYLTKLSQGTMRAEIDSQITKKGEVRFDKLKTRIWINNKEVELNSCSGGERRKVDISIGLALGDISGIETLLFDEWFTDLDSSAMDSAFTILDRLCVNRRVLIATHHERFTETHIVTKTGDTTTVQEVV